MRTDAARSSAARAALLAFALMLALALAALAGGPSLSQATVKADHTGWPTIDGALMINKFGGSRPLDAREGHDPFGGTDPTYSCDGDHKYQGCFLKAGACRQGHHTNMCAEDPVMPLNSRKHHELLGAGGSDTIYAGNAGDVIWGDYKYPPQPLTQHDALYGGPGPDFIYASHGFNEIHTGGGADLVNARYGRGDIYCDSASAVVNLSKRSAARFELHGCTHVTQKAIGTHDYG